MFVTLTLLFLAMVGLGLVLASRVSIVSILVLQMVASIFGMWLLADSDLVPWSVFTTYVCAVAALAGGRLLAGRGGRRVIRAGAQPEVEAGNGGRTIFPHLSAPVMWSVVLVSSALAFYHLYAAGIPILGSNVEVERFDFTSSGLFGIPGRMYLFGLKIAWILACANAAAQCLPWFRYPPWIAASIFLLVASLSSGFKGQILSLAVVAVVTFRLTHRTPFTYWSVLRRFWLVGVAAVGYFLLVGGQYNTYQASDLSVAQSAFNRWTIGSAETPALVLNDRVATVPGNPLSNDFLYYLGRYVGVGPGAPFSLERAVSASITGVNPASAEWVVPVNVGGFAELVATFGVLVAVIAMAAIGWGLGRAELVPPGATVRTATRILAVVMTLSVVVKGGLVYTLVNWSAVAALLFLVGYLAHLLFDRTASPRPGPSGGVPPPRRTGMRNAESNRLSAPHLHPIPAAHTNQAPESGGRQRQPEAV